MMEGSGREPGYFGLDPLKFSAGKSDKVKADFAMKVRFSLSPPFFHVPSLLNLNPSRPPL